MTSDRLFSFLAAALAFCAVSCSQKTSLTSFVNPLVGTDASRTVNAIGDLSADYGKIAPVVGVPHGMTSWVPQTEATERKCIPPYYYATGRIQGFRASHWMNGGCTQDYGSVTVMPMNDVLSTDPKDRSSAFSHETEDSRPYLYSAVLEDYGILGEITGLSRAGIMRFTFVKAGDHYLVIEPNSDERQASLKIDPSTGEVSGSNPVHRIYQGNGKPAGFSGHFVIRTNVKPLDFGLWENDGEPLEGLEYKASGNKVGAWVRIHLDKPGTVLVKVGTSFTSTDNARKNLEAEIPGWNFDKVAGQSEKAWEKTLGCIVAEGGSADKREMFYSALYDAMILPRTYSDVDGSWPGFDYSGTRHSDNVQYGDFSLWDTFRALHPLLTLIDPDLSSRMIGSFLEMGEIGGWLPIFPCWGSYTSEMIGDHGISLIGDAIMKGIEGFDYERAYALMRKNAFEINRDYPSYKDGKGRRALESYLKYGYIPIEDPVREAFHQREQTSRTLEYAYDDFVLAQVAGKLGHDADRDSLIRRASFWKNVIDPGTGYARGRHEDGSFDEPFDPNSKAPYICEGTPYHYTWSVPHDVTGLMEHMGGKDRFTDLLDTFFAEKKYWHGNEPGHHIPYMYAYAGQAWKTQRLVHEIIGREYQPRPDGLSGNDDCGQMSAWLVFSMMGFYPVCPGKPEYALGSPSFPKLTINLPGGKTFTIEAEGLSDENIYIQGATLNGEPYDKSILSHSDILAGGRLVLKMGQDPVKN